MKNNQGFTLVELLITVGLIAVIAVISSDFMFNLLSASIRIQNKIILEQNYTFISNKLVKMIENADSVTFPAGGQSLTIILEGVTYNVTFNGGQININNVPINSPALVEISNVNMSAFNSSNPIAVNLNMDFTISPRTNLSDKVTLQRIVTVRKSYKN